MKRSSLECSDSLGALMTEEDSPSTMMMMLDGIEEELMECSSTTSKKRRLRVDQVKALEKNFEVENKLEPERKVKLAQELGLQPRQVAIWFQNRRARWKTKQLERDYALLKANYDALQLNSHTLQNHNQALRQQIKELKSRVEEEQTTTESDVSVKEEMVTVGAESDEKVTERERRSNVVQLAVETTSSFPESECNKELNYEWLNGEGGVTPADMKDGASDSDTSAILNEDNNNNSRNGGVAGAMNCLELSSRIYESEYGKMEEHNLFSAEEACNFFSEEQAPTLQWYY